MSKTSKGRSTSVICSDANWQIKDSVEVLCKPQDLRKMEYTYILKKKKKKNVHNVNKLMVEMFVEW